MTGRSRRNVLSGLSEIILISRPPSSSKTNIAFQLFTCDVQLVEHSKVQTSDLTGDAALFNLMRSFNLSPPPACGVLCAASHRLDRPWYPRIPGAGDQEGALPGQAGSGWKPRGSVGESRPRARPCHLRHPRHLQPRSVEHGTHTHTHNAVQHTLVHKTWHSSSVIKYVGLEQVWTLGVLDQGSLNVLMSRNMRL